MERKVQMAETVIYSSKKQQLEADELRRELEEARLAERVAKIQLKEVTSSVPQSPPTNSVSMTTAGAIAASATVSCCFQCTCVSAFTRDNLLLVE